MLWYYDWKPEQGDTYKSVASQRLVNLMVFETNALGVFQEDHWYVWHIYLITAVGCPIFQSLGRKQKLCHRNFVRTRNSHKIYVRLASCLKQASYSRKLFGKLPKYTLKKEAYSVQASLVHVPVTTRHDTSMYQAYGPRHLKFQQ
jgi:hypothetical protein